MPLFGTDGVRGLANGSLTADLALSLAQATAVVRALEEILAEEVRDKGETVAIGKVGKFVLKDQPSRMARNPQTGVTAPTEPYKTIQFRPAYSFRAYGKKAKK